ncbi:MAG: amino acid ABC transporter permease [Campylobacterota bacterium]|nr:amino acid ABC transporter permease [Campylobacterota bacterium]
MSILNNQKFRGIFFQLLTVIGLVAFLWYITTNLFTNIEQRGITTGFDFFNQTAGFGIAESPIPYSDSTSTYLDAFYVGILNTLMVSFVGIFFASIIGVVVGVARLSKNFIIAKLSLWYIEFFRNIPILLQILFWYNIVLAALPSPRQSLDLGLNMFLNNRGFYVPKPILESGFIFVTISFVIAIAVVYYLRKWAIKRFDDTGEEFPLIRASLGILILLPLITYFVAGSPMTLDNPALRGFNFGGGMSYSPEFLALTFALSIYTATYIAEAIRSGIEAVPVGQKEAASSLGLSSYKSLKLVVLPQAIRISIPPIINQYLNLTKNSSLATAIGYPELVTVFAGTCLNQTGQAIEIILITMAVYLTISLFISLILNIINKKMEIKGR